MNKVILKLILIYCLFVLCIEIYALPYIIAHRGGGQNFPENTLLAFSKALEIGCDGLELDVQITKDGVVVVYHPHDLSVHTNGSGNISTKNWEEIADLDAGYHFSSKNTYPYRDQGLKIPKLEEVLVCFPNINIILDLKSFDFKKLLIGLTHSISNKEASRLIFYSTQSKCIDWINQNKPQWKTFESRDKTRLRLLEINQGDQTLFPKTPIWIGFELERTMFVKEKLTLGEGISKVKFKLWNPKVVSEIKKSNDLNKIVLFGINTKEDWDEANRLNVDAIYTDNPQKILQFVHSSSL